MAQPLILGKNLRKSFGSTLAVNDLNLAVYPGQIYGLVGPDGAGKTTTIRLLCGALLADGGQAAIGGYDMRQQPELGRQHLGYLSQRFSMYEDLTVMENIRFFAEVRGLSAQEWRPRSQEILEFVGLGAFEDRHAKYLSGGMKQKLGLATALVHRPKALLLDEPTGGVDPVTRQDFWQLIIRLVNEEGVGVLVSTPYMDEAVRCSHVGMLQAGRIVLQGPPREISGRLAGRIVELRANPVAPCRLPAAADPDVEDVQTFGDRLHLRVAAGKAEAVMKRLKKALKGIEISGLSLSVVPPQLEDVFIATMQQDEEVILNV